MLSPQYLVNCLEEDHVCHGITIQEPRPMKEILYSRDHSIVLRRLGSSRMENHQYLHTRGRFDNSAPRKQHSTEGASTPNIGRGAETEPKTPRHSLTTTARTLPSIAELQAYGVRRTNRHLYRLWSSKRHSLQAVELSPRTQAVVQIVSNLPAPSNGGSIYRFMGMPVMRTRWMAGDAAHKSG